MGAIEKAIKKYCRVTNSKFVGYDCGYYFFINDYDGVERGYSQRELLREIDNFE